jgi:hypothetical protein
LFNTHDKLRSVHRLQGGPLSSIMHLICRHMSLVWSRSGSHRTFCLRHDAHALTLRDTTGTDISMFPLDSRGREAGDVDFVSPSTCDQVRFVGGMIYAH